MKKLALVFLLVILNLVLISNNAYSEELDIKPISFPVNIDELSFPDDAFRDYVKNNFDTNNDGVLSEAEAKAVKVIPVGFSYSVVSEEAKFEVTTSNYSFLKKFLILQELKIS